MVTRIVCLRSRLHVVASLTSIGLGSIDDSLVELGQHVASARVLLWVDVASFRCQSPDRNASTARKTEPRC